MMARFVVSLVLFLLSTTQVVVAGSIGSSKWSPKIKQFMSANGDSFGTNAYEASKPILIQFKDQVDLESLPYGISDRSRGQLVYDALREKAVSTQAQVISFIQSQGLKYRAFYIRNMIALYSATPEIIQKVSEFPEVESIQVNDSKKMVPVRIQTKDEDLGPRGIESGLIAIAADQAWSITKGKGIVVAGQDTGIKWDHAALINSYRGNHAGSIDHNYNWHDAIRSGKKNNICGYDLKAPCDDNDHGTHTMGTMVGDDGQGNQIGVAPEAKWMGCRNMNMGEGTASSYIECFEFFLAPYPLDGDPMKDGKPDLAPHIINNSWGCPGSEGCAGGEILPVLKALNKAGIMIVASAGNDGPACDTVADQPATHSDYALVVGAHDHRRDALAFFSSKGPSKFDGKIVPHVVAPGVNIRSSVKDGTYKEAGWSGTSMAGPHAVGAIALLWSARPELVRNIEETRKIMMGTTVQKKHYLTCGGIKGDAIPNNSFGFGLINVHQAINGKFNLNFLH